MAGTPSNRWRLIKSLITFQVKLAFDAIRDLFLSPISFGCALVDIIKNRPVEQSYFKKLMTLGGKTDIWLNLFSQQDYKNKVSAETQTQESLNDSEDDKQALDKVSVKQPFPDKNVDQLFDSIENLLREQHAKGSLTASAKNKIDGYLTKLNQNSADKRS